MKFTPNQVILDDYDRFEADQEYDLPEDRVKYFCSLRWGSSPDIDQSALSDAVSATTPDGPVVLQPHNVSSGSSSEIEDPS